MSEGLKMTSAEAQVLSERFIHTQENVALVIQALQEVNRKLEILPALSASVEHLRTELTADVKDHERRLKLIENDLPGLREMRKWVIAGILASIAMMGVALIKLVIVDVPRIPGTTTTTVQQPARP